MPLWDSRFKKALADITVRFSSSIDVDKRLYREDIEGSLAHVEMLVARKILTADEGKKITKGLLEIQKEIEREKIDFPWRKEDVHMAMESRLIQKIGAVGGKLHTARSRNDQIALDERLYLRKTINEISQLIRKFQKTLVNKAEQYFDLIIPGYTHTQRAQPILFSHHLLAHISMLERDLQRFQDCHKRVNRSPLGVAALAGTSFPIDREAVARKLRFDGVVENSIDAVSDRDFIAEFLSACAITMMHLSRFAEELVWWSSSEFHFAEIGDKFATGSSIMPQKKNPDIAELIRGKTGRVYGDLIALLTVMKGLPLSYNRDMQEDKEPMFDAADTVKSCLEIFNAMLRQTEFNRDRFSEELQKDFLTATEIADYLVRKGVPFRQAHSIAGKIVSQCEGRKIALTDLSLPEYKKFSPKFEKDIYQCIDPTFSVQQKKSLGSTSPKEVKKAIREWKRLLKKNKGRGFPRT